MVVVLLLNALKKALHLQKSCDTGESPRRNPIFTAFERLYED